MVDSENEERPPRDNPTRSGESVKPPVAPRKTADRPHVVTIILGLISPALSVVAVVIALHSLRVSNMSMRVGQRAYVAIQNGSFSMSGHESVPVNRQYVFDQRMDIATSFDI